MEKMHFLIFSFLCAGKRQKVLSDKDKELLELLKIDDQEAMRLLFVSYHSLLCRVAHRLTGNKAEAKDVVQDVFIKFWNNRRSVVINTSVEAYLKRAAVNTSLNRIEQKNRFIKFDHLQWQDNKGENTTEHVQDYHDLSRKVDAAVRNLPSRTRVIFTLIRFEDMSYKEVAETLNISVKAVEKEIMKALKILRSALKDYLFILSVSFAGEIFLAM